MNQRTEARKKRKEIRALLLELKELQAEELFTRKNIRRNVSISQDDIAYQTRLSKLTSRINFLKFGAKSGQAEDEKSLT